MASPDRIATLPKWAREHIESLQRELDDALSALDSANVSETLYGRPPDDWAHKHDAYVRHDSFAYPFDWSAAYVVTMPDGGPLRAETIEARVMIRDGRPVGLRVTSDAATRLAVFPASSNTVEISLVDSPSEKQS